MLIGGTSMGFFGLPGPDVLIECSVCGEMFPLPLMQNDSVCVNCSDDEEDQEDQEIGEMNEDEDEDS